MQQDGPAMEILGFSQRERDDYEAVSSFFSEEGGATWASNRIGLAHTF